MASFKNCFVSKSLLETFYSGGNVNLNSKNDTTVMKREDENRNNLHDKLMPREVKNENTSFNTRKITFEVKFEGVEANFKQEMQVIDSIRKLNFLKWMNEFEELAELNKWSGQQRRDILQRMIRDDSISREKITDKFESTRDYLLSVAYPKEISNSILSRLENTRQVEFYLIEDYMNQLKDNLNIYSINNSVTKAEYARRLEEMFYRNLGERTRMEIIKFSFKDFTECFKYLKITENKILAELDRNNAHVEAQPTKNQGIEKEFKWCKWHKKCAHETKDCYFNSDKKSESRKSSVKKGTNAIIKESQDDINSMEIPVSIKNAKVEAMLDSGASRNYIDTELVKSIGLNKSEDKPILIKFGNKSEQVSKMSCIVQMIVEGIDEHIQVKCYAIKNCIKPLILGHDFLSTNRAVLDYSKQCLIIFDKVISTNSTKIEPEEIEKILSDRLCSSSNEAIDHETKSLIREYTHKNHEFTKIKGESVKIKLIKKEELNLKMSQRRKFYTVPHKYLEGAVRRLQS